MTSGFHVVRHSLQPTCKCGRGEAARGGDPAGSNGFCWFCCCAIATSLEPRRVSCFRRHKKSVLIICLVSLLKKNLLRKPLNCHAPKGEGPRARVFGARRAGRAERRPFHHFARGDSERPQDAAHMCMVSIGRCVSGHRPRSVSGKLQAKRFPDVDPPSFFRLFRKHLLLDCSFSSHILARRFKSNNFASFVRQVSYDDAASFAFARRKPNYHVCALGPRPATPSLTPSPCVFCVCFCVCV
jgi:hypothetical protein